MYKCLNCSYSSKRSTDLRRHENSKHKQSEFNEIYNYCNISSANLNMYNNCTLSSTNRNIYDVRLNENFKVFISGPLQSGKLF